MYQTVARPSSLSILPTPAHSRHINNSYRWKDSSVCHKLPSDTVGRDGLQTPPADDMSAAYPHQHYTSYSNQHRDAIHHTNGLSANQYMVTTAQNLPHASLDLPGLDSTSNLRNEVAQVQPPPPPSSRLHSPQRADVASKVPSRDEYSRSKSTSTGDAIRANLQIPRTISTDSGSLPDFAAQITCLFWFESIETLNEAEKHPSSSLPAKRLRPEAIPSTGFRKWVVTILSTTQVTDKVIILALLFIYRLKTYNSAVKGRTGSEYRLLTVALMLGNKFLDDNTYTNKTWAEVSGISVQEIHVMEVEFLSNMRYSLLASAEQWKEWHQKLSMFKHYCEAAARAPPFPQVSPHSGQILPPMPSPPESTHASPPPSNYGMMAVSATHRPTSHAPSSTLPPLPPYPRKRSFDGDVERPVAKRVTRSSGNGAAAVAAAVYATNPHVGSDAPRLPVPNLTITTTHGPHHGYNGNSNGAQQKIVLPPPGNLSSSMSSRSMASGYMPNPSTPTTWTSQLPMPMSSHNVLPNSHGYSTPSRRHSPHAQHSVQDLLSYNASPTSSNFPGHPGHLSPSIFLQQRSSPYKPVRHVNTLLYPPPSGSLHDNSVNAEEMRYRPLGSKRDEYRTGVVPHVAFRQPNFYS